MNSTSFNNPKLEWLNSTFRFFQKHFLMIFTLGFIAGLGRVIQLKGFGEISTTTNIVMEVIVESARLIMLIYILGSASLRMGYTRVAKLFKRNHNQKEKIKLALANLKRRWPILLLNFSVYLLIAWTINFLIDQLAYETCLYLSMQNRGILSQNASEWTIILFFKNLTVIPLTLIFNTLFVLYLTDRLRAKAVPISI